MRTAEVFSILLVSVALGCGTVTASKPWVAVVSFECRGLSRQCVGAIVDKQWVVTTASCFHKCRNTRPEQVNVYVGIPRGAQKRFSLAMQMGKKIVGSLEWVHEDYNSKTFANNLALVKLGCHNYAVERIQIAASCSAYECQQEDSGYLYTKRKSINFEAFNWTITESEKQSCLASQQGGSTLYYCADTLQLGATWSRRNGCNLTQFCKSAERIKSFLEENMLNCNTPVPVVDNIVPTASQSSVAASSSITASSVADASTVLGKPSLTEIPKESSLISTPSSVKLPALVKTTIPISVNSVTLSLQPNPTKVPSSTELPTSREFPVQSHTLTSSKRLSPTARPHVTAVPKPTDILLPVETSTLPAPTVAISSTEGVDIPTLTQTEMPTSTAPVSTKELAPTPTEASSGCILSIPNGVATVVKTRVHMEGLVLIEYHCNVGYRFDQRQQTKSLLCVNNEMTYEPPPCKRITCPPPEPLDNGAVSIIGLGLGSTAQYSCRNGFVISGGFTVRVCKADGTWSGEAGFCKRMCSVPPPITCSDGHRIVTAAFKFGAIGDTATYAVTDGYVLLGEMPVCQPDSTWSKPPKCLKLCNESQVIPNADVLVHRNTTSYTRSIQCREGYEADGYPEQHCTNSGSWTPYFKECTKICRGFVLDRGIVQEIGSNSFLIAIMSCEPGFHLEPELDTIFCTNGVWESEIPRCVMDT